MINCDAQLDAGNEFADYLIKHFGIKTENLVAGAYMDLILEAEDKIKTQKSKSPPPGVKEPTEGGDCETVEASSERIERDVTETFDKKREQEAAETLATIIKKEEAAKPKRARRTK